MAGAAAQHEDRRVRREDVGAVGRGPGRPADPPARRRAPPTSPCATPTSTCRCRWPSRVNALDAMPAPLAEGARVVVQAKPVFWTQRGSLMLDARQIRPVGVGELLARLEHLKRRARRRGPVRRRAQAAAAVPAPHGRPGLRPGQRRREGRRRERPPPLADGPVRDPRGRRPGRRRGAARSCAALAELDARPRASTSSSSPAAAARSRTCCRSATRPWSARSRAARTPVVSAIGHDVDTPLLDLVADWRASTPTDAGKRVVPDVGRAARRRRPVAGPRRAAPSHGRVASERRHLVAAALPPGHGRPGRDDRRPPAGARRAHRPRPPPGARRGAPAADQVGHLRAQVRTLSPQSTLDRGYAVVQHRDGRVVTDQAEVEVDELLRVRVARGDFARPGRRACPRGRLGCCRPWPRAIQAVTPVAETAWSATVAATDADRSRHRRAVLRAGPRRAGRRSSPSSRAARSASRRACALWQRGEALAAHCSTWLDGAEAALSQDERATTPADRRRRGPRPAQPVGTGRRLSAKAVSSSNVPVPVTIVVSSVGPCARWTRLICTLPLRT